MAAFLFYLPPAAGVSSKVLCQELNTHCNTAMKMALNVIFFQFRHLFIHQLNVRSVRATCMVKI